ncbi:MAG: PAS domain-containing sensor histidine kinase, partial [bacterium]
MRLLWRIYIYFFVSTILALAVTDWYANHSLRRFYLEQVASELLTRANILVSELRNHALDKDAEQIDQHCKEFGRLTQTRVTVILAEGRVIGD